MQSDQESSAARRGKVSPRSPFAFSRVVGILWRHSRTFRSLLRHEFHRRWNLSGKQRFQNGLSAPPVTLNLDLTRRCNLKCMMCNQHRHAAAPPLGLGWYDPKQELPLSTWTDLLDQVASFRPRPKLYITGGEPTLHRDFPELIQAAKKRGFMVHIQTNGTRLGQLAEFLVAQGVEMLSVSLDGPPEIHDFIRGQVGAFKRSAAGIAALMDARERLGKPGPLLSISCVISKANLGCLDQMVPLALDLGADTLHLMHTIFNSETGVARHNLLMSPRWSQTHGVDLISPSIPAGEYYQSEIRPEDLPALQRNLERVRRLARGRLFLTIHPNLPLGQLESYYLDLNYPSLQGCNALWDSCRILSDGTVSPCLHVVTGKITEQPFLDIWNGPRMRNFRQVIAHRLLPGCARCCHRRFN
jgi:MoaA/NifB/PqqE/SkfB family radical SAM enzyme